MIRHFILALTALLFLSACGGGGSDSGSMVEATLPGTNVPISFIGTYQGTLNVNASALGNSISDSFPITITVNEDGTIRFDGDDPDETFTVGLQNDGVFQGNLPLDQSGCTGNVGANGQVDGNNVTGTIDGSGSCEINGLSVDVELAGDFNATRI